MVAVVPVALALAPPGLAVTVYPVMALPPLLAGAVQLTLALALPAVAVTPVGAAGAVVVAVGVTGADAAENVPVPCALVARTVNV